MLQSMQREVDWIIEALERDPAKTKTGLARALGIDKSGVSRMLKGGRRLKFEEAQRAAEYLGTAPGGSEENGFAEPEEGYIPAPLPERLDGVTAFYACSSGADGLWRLDLQRAIERRPQTPQLAGADLAFGFYAPDDAMAPRFLTGETVWTNPARPATKGHDALLMAIDAPPNEMTACLCRLEAKTADHFQVSQYGDKRIREFPSAAWRAVHVYGRE